MQFFIINKNGTFTKNWNSTQLTGEKIPGDLDSWNQYSTDPNIILRDSYNLLSERSTSLYHTHPPVSKAIEAHTTYAIGSGLIFRSQPDWEILGMTKPQAKAWGMQLQKLIHYAFLMLNFYEKQAIIFRTAKIQGDSLLLFDRKEPIDGLPFDLIETGGDQIDWQKDSATANGLQVRLGIQTDKFLRRKGVYLQSAEQPVPFTDDNGFQNLIQFFERKIARQLRGYPLAYRIIAAAKNNDRTWDAVLNRMGIEASVIGVEESDPANVNEQYKRLAAEARAAQLPDISGSTGTNPANITTEGNVNKLGGGNILSMQKGGKFNWLEMKTPSSNFKVAQDAFYELVGMGTETPPEVVKSLYGGSYTAHMGAINDFEKTYMRERGGFITIVGYPVVRELAKFFIANRMLDMPNDQFFKNPIIQRAALAGKWLGPVPGVINPTDQANANETKVRNGFMLRSDAAMQNGYDWDNFIEEYAQEEEEWQKASPAQKAEVIQNDMKNNNQNNNGDNSDNTDNTDNTDNNNTGDNE